jgi:hypothetical protein
MFSNRLLMVISIRSPSRSINVEPPGIVGERGARDKGRAAE